MPQGQRSSVETQRTTKVVEDVQGKGEGQEVNVGQDLPQGDDGNFQGEAEGAPTPDEPREAPAEGEGTAGSTQEEGEQA